MSKTKQTPTGTLEEWESGAIGAEEAFARLSENINGEAVDDELGLQLISIRLDKSLIDTLKLIASVNGIGYQPLIRKQLHRFAESEVKRLYKQQIADEKAAKDDGAAPKKCA